MGYWLEMSMAALVKSASPKRNSSFSMRRNKTCENKHDRDAHHLDHDASCILGQQKHSLSMAETNFFRGSSAILFQKGSDIRQFCFFFWQIRTCSTFSSGLLRMCRAPVLKLHGCCDLSFGGALLDAVAQLLLSVAEAWKMVQCLAQILHRGGVEGAQQQVSRGNSPDIGLVHLMKSVICYETETAETCVMDSECALADRHIETTNPMVIETIHKGSSPQIEMVASAPEKDTVTHSLRLPAGARVNRRGARGCEKGGKGIILFNPHQNLY